MADLSKMSDADLAAIAGKDLSKVSDAGLAMLAGSPVAAKDDKPWWKAALEGVAMSGGSGGPAVESANFSRPQSQAEADATSTGLRKGLAQGARYGIPLAGSVGGPVGSATAGGGETLAQLIEGGKVSDPGAVGQASVIGAVPFSKAKGIAGIVGNAARYGVGAAAGEQVKSAMDTGDLASKGDTGTAAAIAAALPVISPILGKILGAITKNVSPEDMARVQSSMSQNKLEDQTLKTMADRGAVIRPTQVNPSGKNSLYEMIAGKTKLDNMATEHNTPIVNAVAREEATIPKDVAMDEPAFNAARAKIAAPYEEARRVGLGPQLEAWQITHDEAKLYNGGPLSVVERREKDVAKAVEEAAFTSLRADAMKIGRPDLADALKQARTDFAKNYDVQAATNVGNGDVESRVLAQMLNERGDKGLTGGLNDLARFQQAFPDAVKPRGRLATAPSVLTAAASTMAAAPSVASGDIKGAILGGGLPMLRGPVARHIMSPEYQRANAVRRYDPKTSASPEMMAKILQQLELAARNRGDGQ